MLPFDWHQVIARFWLTIRFPSSISILLPSTTKGKLSGSRGDACIRNSSRHESSLCGRLRIRQGRPDWKHTRLKALARVDVVDEDAAVGTAVEGDAKGLEALLSCRVPELHRDEPVVNHDLLGQEVGANRRCVTCVSDRREQGEEVK
jgi:hypothetical protein